MKTTFLDFEQPVAELEAKIDELRYVQDDSALDISEEIARLQKKSQALTKEIYGKLSAWQIAQVARHPQRPYSLDYFQSLFTGFEELHGDRAFADDPAIVGGDPLLMLQYSTYSVISPEGCASILWKSAEHAPAAAESLGITAIRLKALGLIDKIVNEPLGGAHRDHDTMTQNLKKALHDSWRSLQNQPIDELLGARYERLMDYGKFKEVAEK